MLLLWKVSVALVSLVVVLPLFNAVRTMDAGPGVASGLIVIGPLLLVGLSLFVLTYIVGVAVTLVRESATRTELFELLVPVPLALEWLVDVTPLTVGRLVELWIALTSLSYLAGAFLFLVSGLFSAGARSDRRNPGSTTPARGERTTTRHCPQCGKGVPPDGSYCPGCGVLVETRGRQR